MRTTIFAPDEYYHLCGRGLDKQILFHDQDDWARFLFLILHFQSPTPLNNISTYTRSFLKHGRFGISPEKLSQITKDRSLELVSFALMPNHFHLLVRNVTDQAISIYMQRVLMAYGKYFNTKYERFGHVFDGPFRSTHIKDNEQLIYTAAYIHKNPKSLPEYTERYKEYPYSSYQDFVKENRWGKLLCSDILLEQFKGSANFQHFTETSAAKEKEIILEF